MFFREITEPEPELYLEKRTVFRRSPLRRALLLPGANAAGPQTRIEQNTTTYSVGLNTTRLIYTPASQGASLTISNPNSFPILAQSKVTAADSAARA